MSASEASTNSPGHLTTYFRTSISEASQPQGPDTWYQIFYQNKVLIYQTIVTNSLQFKISHYFLYETMELNLKVATRVAPPATNFYQVLQGNIRMYLWIIIAENQYFCKKNNVRAT